MQPHRFPIGPRESSTQTASRSVHSFLHSLPLCSTHTQTDRQTHRPRYFTTSVATARITACSASVTGYSNVQKDVDGIFFVEKSAENRSDRLLYCHSLSPDSRCSLVTGRLRCIIAASHGSAPWGSGTFRTPLLFSGLRRFVHLVRWAAAALMLPPM